jgi:hypothetical protein
MPLHKILASLDQQVKPEVIKDVINYMKSMPKEHETLVLQCAEHINKSQTLASVLAVAHALNEEEILLKCRDDDILESDLSNEFEKMLDEKKKDGQPLQQAQTAV